MIKKLMDEMDEMEEERSMTPEEAKSYFSNYQERTFRQYQREAIEFVANSPKRFRIVEAATGCIAEGSQVLVNRGANSDIIPIERAVKHFNHKGDYRYYWKREIPSYVRSFNGEEVRLSPATNFLYSGIKEVMKLILSNGKTLRATPDHLIMTNDGFVKMASLCPGMLVMCDQRRPQKSETKKKKICDTPVSNLWFHPYAVKAVSRPQWGRGYTMKIEKHRAIYEAHLNGLTLDEYKEILRRDQKRANSLVFVNPNEYHIHHKDGDHNNNDISNLVKENKKGHLKYHAKNGVGHKNFSQGIPYFSEVISIENDGISNTYDVTTPEYENFAVNDIIVHNSGKSLIAMISGRLAGDCTYMVHSKILQKQITTDFPEAKSLFGRANYPCRFDSSRDCSQCIDTPAKPCPFKASCIYPMEKKATLAHKLRILNYDYFLTESNFIGQFSKLPFTIVDEADNLENSLIGFIALSFSERSLNRLALPPHPSRKTVTAQGGLQSWIDFGNAAIERAGEVTKKLNQEISTWKGITHDWQQQKLRDQQYFSNIVNKSKMFVENVDETWLMEEKQGLGSRGSELIFRPLWITPKLAEAFMWRHSKVWVLMSASFLPLPILSKTLGIPLDEIDYTQVPSTFPVSRRPIHTHAPDHMTYSLANMTAKTTEEQLPILCHAITEIMDHHSGEKGLIHCVSFKLGKSILESINSPRLILHNSHDRQIIVDKFLDSRGDSVLLSPSLERGISLENDLCRFIVVAKMPFLYLGDKIVQKRVHSGYIGQDWYIATALLTILQMTGRGMRSESDSCTSYILDSQFLSAFSKKPLYLPQWWKDAEVW